MAIEKFNFSSDFQDMLLAALCRNPEEFSGINTILEYKYFSGLNAATTAQLILEYYKEYQVFPSFTALGQLAIEKTKQLAGTEFTTDLMDYVHKLSELTIRDVSYLKQAIVRFATERALLIAASEVVATVREGKEPQGVIEKFQSAIAIGQQLQHFGYDIREDAAEIMDKLLDESWGTFTGFDLIDRTVWKHGMKPGWLIVPLAPPKRYKTAFCLNLALNVCGPEIGGDVVYYACEINEELAAMRTYLRLTQKTEDELHSDPMAFAEELARGFEKFLVGRLFIKHFPAKTATISDIRAHLKALVATKGYVPKMIVIDYAETILPPDAKQPPARQQSDIYTGARHLADEFGCVVILPDRCNRETVDKPVPSMTSFQGAFEKAGIVDGGIGLCQTDDEYHQGVIRFFLFLNRHGEAGLHFRGKVDAARMTITVDQQLEWDELKAIEVALEKDRDDKLARRRGQGDRNRRQRLNREALNEINRDQ